MELSTIIKARKTLDGFSSIEGLSAHLAYWMTKFVVKTQDEYVFYIQEMQKLFAKFSIEKDGSFVIPPEKMADFNTAVEFLNSTAVEDPNIRFSLSELSTELKLSMKQMYTLLPFIDEEK